MFSGIVEGIGTVREVDATVREVDATAAQQQETSDKRAMRIVIEAPAAIMRRLKRGVSIAAQGVCLTVTDTMRRKRRFAADIISTTYAHTTIGQWKVGREVNLETALSVGGVFGGHLVQGHVTGVGTVRRVSDETEHERAIDCTIDSDQRIAIVQKGSITIDGISFTVAKCSDDGFAVGITPHTWAETTVHHLRVGSQVNIETDVFLRAAAEQLQRMIAQAGRQ